MSEVTLLSQPRRWLPGIIAIIALAAVLVLREPPDAQRAPAAAAPPEQHAAAGGDATDGVPARSTRAAPQAKAAPVPAGARLPINDGLFGGLSVPAVDSWEMLLAELDAGDRQLVEAFAARYPGAFDFVRTEQLEWMLENGFPMPEEIAAAAKMPMEELLRLAYAGNHKAQALTLDRMAVEWVEAGVPPFVMPPLDEHVSGEPFRRLGEMGRLSGDLQASCSVFGSGYAQLGYAHIRAAFFGRDPRPARLALLIHLHMRGDHRVGEEADWLARQLGSGDELTQSALFASHHHYSGLYAGRCRYGRFP
jgi:hypothetical protein